MEAAADAIRRTANPGKQRSVSWSMTANGRRLRAVDHACSRARHEVTRGGRKTPSSPQVVELNDADANRSRRVAVVYHAFHIDIAAGIQLQMPDLKERLTIGPVIVFEFPRNGYEITWPKYDLGTLFEIGETGAVPWTLSLNNGRN